MRVAKRRTNARKSLPSKYRVGIVEEPAVGIEPQIVDLDASDVETMTGIRDASGRLRPVVRFLAGASRRLREGRDAAAATPP